MRNAEKKNLECGLRPIGDLGAYDPEGSRKKEKPMEPGNKPIEKSVFKCYALFPMPSDLCFIIPTSASSPRRNSALSAICPLSTTLCLLTSDLCLLTSDLCLLNHARRITINPAFIRLTSRFIPSPFLY